MHFATFREAIVQKLRTKTILLLERRTRLATTSDWAIIFLSQLHANEHIILLHILLYNHTNAHTHKLMSSSWRHAQVSKNLGILGMDAQYNISVNLICIARFFFCSKGENRKIWISLLLILTTYLTGKELVIIQIDPIGYL